MAEGADKTRVLAFLREGRGVISTDRPGHGAPGPEHTAEDVDRIRGKQHTRLLIARLAIPLLLLALMAFFQTKNDQFLTGDNLRSVLEFAALPAIVACGLTLVLILNQFDLSIQAVAGFATTGTAAFVVNEGMPVIVAMIVVLLLAAAVGAFNGMLVAYVGVSALVVTIAVGSFLNGSEFAISDSKPIPGIPASFTEFARGTIFTVPNLVIVALAVAIVLWVLVDKTAFGREMRAIGNNPDAARFAGVNVRRIILIGFVLSAVLAAFAGFLYTGRQGVVYPLTGMTLLLQSFAACFLGAAMFRIGEFNIPGTIVGVLLAAVVQNGLLLANVADYATYFFQAAILVAAVVFARFVAGARATE